LHRYKFAAKYVENLRVLDIASGEGYGSFLLSLVAKNVVGVDIDKISVRHATKSYSTKNLSFLLGDCAQIPLEDACVDVVVSFETIEHHDKHDEMMRQIKRVLTPAGIMIMSSPDKQFFSIEPQYSNPFHVKELYENEFRSLVGEYFKNSSFYAQKIIFGSALFPEKLEGNLEVFSSDFNDLKNVNGIPKPLYWIVVASDSNLPTLSCGIMEEAIENSEIASNGRTAVHERDLKIIGLESEYKGLEAEVEIFQARLELLTIKYKTL